MGPRWRPGSLRFRLTALAAVVVAVVLIGTAIALVAIQQRQLTANLDGSLEQRADTLEAEFANELSTTLLAGNDEDRAVQLVAVDGAVLLTSSNLLGQPTIASRLGPDTVQVIATRDDLPLEDDAYRVLTRRVGTPDGLAVLHVAENVDDLNEALAVLTATLSITVPVVVALLAALMWWLTGRTLGPVGTIGSEVDAITTTDSHHRVHIPGSDDEISRLAVTMNNMLDRLDDAADKQRRFVADAAHELRTPLTRIRTTAEVDLAHPDSADRTATNTAVRDEVIELQHLIDDLLHLARTDSGDTGPAHRPVDLDDIVLAEIRQQRAVTDVSIDASGVSGANLNGNPDHLARAVRNLLSNATHHARSAVTVTLRESDGTIELTVADDGPGVLPEHRDQIFERFARVDHARTRSDGGTGLGLAITRDIVERHNGSVTYDASFARGARFVVSLRRRAVDDERS